MKGVGFAIPRSFNADDFGFVACAVDIAAATSAAKSVSCCWEKDVDMVDCDPDGFRVNPNAVGVDGRGVGGGVGDCWRCLRASLSRRSSDVSP